MSVVFVDLSQNLVVKYVICIHNGIHIFNSQTNLTSTIFHLGLSLADFGYNVGHIFLSKV